MCTAIDSGRKVLCLNGLRRVSQSEKSQSDNVDIADEDFPLRQSQVVPINTPFVYRARPCFIPSSTTLQIHIIPTVLFLYVITFYNRCKVNGGSVENCKNLFINQFTSFYLELWKWGCEFIVYTVHFRLTLLSLPPLSLFL